MGYQCFSQRLLNPFRGITNTIRYQSAEAVTADGVKWDIYVSNDGLLKGLPYNRGTQVSDIRYGSWTLDSGLKRGPLYPSDDFKRLEQMGDKVYEHLLKVHQQIPFPFEDSFELWLLDSEDRPLALIDSAMTASDIYLDQSLAWQVKFKSLTDRLGFRLARTLDTQGCRRIKGQPLQCNRFSTQQAISIFTPVQSPQRGRHFLQQQAAPAATLLRHRLSLQGIHPGKPPDTGLIEFNRFLGRHAGFPLAGQLRLQRQ